jgi:predicted glycosyltransferase
MRTGLEPLGPAGGSPLRVLFDVVHAADVLFFRRPILHLESEGHEFLVLSRHKDVACDLLDEFGIPHRPISTAGHGIVGLATELVRRTARVAMAARRFRPHAMLGFGGVAIAQAGAALRMPSIAFYDTEQATLQNSITWPLIDRLFVPTSYAAKVPSNRTVRLRGVKELSYLRNLRPDRDIAMRAGLDPSRDNFFVRIVEWRANHDLGKAGWDEALIRDLISRLPGRVHISSERALPADLEPLRYKGRLSHVHHLIGHCRAYIGESATMASEAAMLGIAAIYASDDRLGYIDELVAAGLVLQCRPDLTPFAVDALLQRHDYNPMAARDAYVGRCDDWCQAVIDAALST